MEDSSRWSCDIAMYRVVKKLKRLKKSLKFLSWSKGNLHDRVKTTRQELDEIQRRLDADPQNDELRLDQSAWLTSFNNACI